MERSSKKKKYKWKLSMRNNFTAGEILVILINQLKVARFLMFTGDFTKMVKGLTKKGMKKR